MTEEEYYEDIYDNADSYDTDDRDCDYSDSNSLWVESYRYHVENLVYEE